jgi:23S rRNA (uracil1939-C5)-methyltransferase
VSWKLLVKKTTEKSTGAFEITIDRLVFGGAGLGRHEGKVAFAPFSAPGDHLLVRPIEDKKQFIRVEIIKVLKPGPGRIAPVCRHFMKCGGCHWQQLEYLRQVEAKRKILEEILHHRFPQTRDLQITMKACPQPFGYRTRARLQLRGPAEKPFIGFYRRESHSVEDVKSCPLLRPSLNEALSSIRKWTHEPDALAEIQEIEIACSEEDDSWSAVHAGSSVDEDVSFKDEIVLHKRVGEFCYSFSAPVFFQANEFMVSKLVSLARTAFQNAGHGVAVDLFAGVGLFTLPLASQFKKVLAVESSRPACRFCSKNLADANFPNAQVICSDVFQWMKSAESKDDLDLVLLDPPRTGAGTDVMEQIRKWEPKTIIYVSCDPQTLCRDLAKISNFYTIDLAEGLDMFPQTYHFETVVRLTKNF